MAQSLPWSVKGIDADTRDAAREAARRAGMSVSDWLEHLIREEARRGQAEAPTQQARSRSASGDIEGRLRRLSTTRAATDRGDEPERRELDLLLDHATALEARTRETEAKTTTALESILGWIEKAESRMAASERAAAERQERATSVIADAIKTVSSRVSDVERRAAPSPHRAPLGPVRADSAPDRQHLSPRRATLSREGLASALSDIQLRQRELDEPERAPERRRPAVMDNLREDLNRVVGLPQGERRIGERRADVTPLMNTLRADLNQLRSEIASLASVPASSRLEDSIRELAQRLEHREPLPLDELARPLARIEAELGRLQQADPAMRFSRIENELQRMGGRIEELVSHAQEPRLLGAAVQELSSLKEALLRGQQAPGLDDLSTQIATLARDIGRVREEIGRANPATDIENAIEAMREALMRETRDAHGIGQGLLQRISHQMETVSEAVRQNSASGQGDAERSELALLSHKLDQLAQRTQPESDALARRIEDLAIKLDDLSGRGSSEVLERVERLSQQIEAMTARGPAALEKQIDKLAARIESLAKAQPVITSGSGMPAVNLTPIEDMINDLARKLTEVSRPDASSTGLEALERQIAALADRLDTRPAVPGPGDGLERTLQDLMRSLGGLRDETASAVDKAARAAVADALARSPASPAEAAGLSDLRHDLAGLKDVHLSIDRRTHSAIGAVNDTLEKIVQRLAQLEDDIARDKPAERSGDSATRFDAGMPPAEAPMARRAAARTAPPRDAMQDHAGGFDAEAASPAFSEKAAQPARMSARELMASAQRAVRGQPTEPMPAAQPHQPVRQAAAMPAQPSLQEETAELQAERLPDMPLEPGSGRPRGRTEPRLEPATSSAASSGTMGAGPAGSINPNLIAAARRAALAASAEAEAIKGEEAKGTKGKLAKIGKISMPISLRETLEKRRKPILLGLAAIVLAMGAGRIATSLLDEPAPTVQSRAAEPAGAPTTTDSVPQPGRNGAPDASEAGAARNGSPADLPSKDQTSLGAPVVQPGAQAISQRPGGGAAADTTSSIRPIEVAALPPATAAPDTTRFTPDTAAPGRVTNLGELAPTIGTPGLRRAALEGNPNAVYELASRASDGVGMARDQKLALRLFERAAAAGSAPAQFRLGNMHEKGIGTARDAKLAMSWYRRAAEKGNAKAMHNLAVLLAEGADGRPDYAGAAEMFRKAAELGVRDSQYNLAILLGRGLGVEQDLTQSYTWFAVAAREGDADAGKKRDEVGAKLTAVDLSAGRTASLSWRPKTPDPIANDVAAPAEGWDPQPRPAPRTPAKPRAT